MTVAVAAPPWGLQEMIPDPPASRELPAKPVRQGVPPSSPTPGSRPGGRAPARGKQAPQARASSEAWAGGVLRSARRGCRRAAALLLHVTATCQNGKIDAGGAGKNTCPVTIFLIGRMACPHAQPGKRGKFCQVLV